MRDIIAFLYRDDKIIESLHNQKYDEIVEIILTSSEEDEVNSSVSASFLKLVSSDIKGKIHGSNNEQNKIIPSIDRKAKRLIDIYASDSLDIYKIIKKNIPFSESIYFVGRASFFLRKISHDNIINSIEINSTTNEINEHTIFEFESGDTDEVKKYASQYFDSNDFFICDDNIDSKIAIRMSLSNSKIIKSIRHISYEISVGKHFDLNIFGELTPSRRLLNDDISYFIINPFVVW